MKKFLALLLCAVMVFSFAACSGNTTGGGEGTDTKGNDTANDGEKSDLKIGIILVGDENEGYTYAHIEGIKSAMSTLGIAESQVIWKYSIPEDEKCAETADDLIDQGCTAIFSNSYNHQTYMQQKASENPDVTFVAATGDTAAISGLSNFKNCFTGVYESRYVSGVVAGMKLAELVKDGKIEDANKDADGNIKIGYVGAYPYAEVVSGYTAFLLGIQSIVPEAHMDVQYTNSWYDPPAESEAANILMARGCVIIGQHADSTGAPAAVQAQLGAGKTVYSVGYNVDMLSVAPTAALTSATNVWGVYYTYAFGQLQKGEEIATDWAKGYADGAVAITELGKSCAEGTQEKVDAVIAAIKDGTLHVFDINTFTVGGEKVESCKVDMTGDFDIDDEEDKEAIWDGYFHESELRSAPSFSLRIDGITELNSEG